ncbi:MAG TPA: hypothetical protein VJV03_06355 [Pyrinomonadaceae bacterium]|nr:hypothetical protein [Pyrinomonadaceae bacterium]
MSEEELQLLVTLDDPEYGPKEDTFDHELAEKTKVRHDQRAEDLGGSQQ